MNNRLEPRDCLVQKLLWIKSPDGIPDDPPGLLSQDFRLTELDHRVSKDSSSAFQFQLQGIPDASIYHFLFLYLLVLFHLLLLVAIFLDQGQYDI